MSRAKPNRCTNLTTNRKGSSSARDSPIHCLRPQAVCGGSGGHGRSSHQNIFRKFYKNDYFFNFLIKKFLNLHLCRLPTKILCHGRPMPSPHSKLHQLLRANHSHEMIVASIVISEVNLEIVSVSGNNIKSRRSCFKNLNVGCRPKILFGGKPRIVL